MGIVGSKLIWEWGFKKKIDLGMDSVVMDQYRGIIFDMANNYYNKNNFSYPWW